jgi:hypothetical protein
MFVRWQARKHTERSSYLGGSDDVHWRADLVESVRINGKPRQRHIAYLVGFTEQQLRAKSVGKRRGKVRLRQQLFVWQSALDRLDSLGDRVSDVDRARIEESLAGRIGMPKPSPAALVENGRHEFLTDDQVRALVCPS